MEGNYRTRIKVGQHEFEAEGPVDVVQQQVKRFMELIANLPSDVIAHPYYKSGDTPSAELVAAAMPTTPEMDSTLNKIMKVKNRTVSLTARPRTSEDAVLLLLFGQKALRENDAVTGGEVMDGIESTGGLSVQRADRLLEKLGRDGDAIVIGERRSKRYRLTSAGLAKARQIASDLIATVA